MRYFIAIILLFTALTTHGQTTDSARYFKHPDSQEEVPMEKARYIEYTRRNNDGSVTTERYSVKTHTLVRSQEYKNGVPYGLWIIANDAGEVKEQYDYRFETSYEPVACISPLTWTLAAAHLTDSIEGTFVPPVIAGAKSYNDFLAYNLRYPAPAQEAGWAGRVVIKGTLTKEGKLTGLYVAESAYKILDAEAMRVVRMIRFSKPAMLMGKPADVCIEIPISFRLE